MPDSKRDAVLAQTLIKTRLEPDLTIIAVTGELDLASANQLDSSIREAEQNTTGWIVVDLGDLRFLDSTGLNVLLQTRRRANENGNRISFIHSRHEQVTRLLSITETNGLLFS
jgi:anti-sigma B factor antagonist